jgi:hypothetical protein
LKRGFIIIMKKIIPFCTILLFMSHCSKSDLEGMTDIFTPSDYVEEVSDVVQPDVPVDTAEPDMPFDAIDLVDVLPPDADIIYDPDVPMDYPFDPDVAPDADVIPDLPMDFPFDREIPPDIAPDFPRDYPFDREVPPDMAPDFPRDSPRDFPRDLADVPDDGTCVGGIVGDACFMGSQCNCVPGSARECLTDLFGFLTFPGGYCSAQCTSTAECGDGANCAELMTGAFYCLKLCSSVSQCRMSERYTCMTIPMGGDPRTYCLPQRGSESSESSPFPAL